MGTGEGGRLEEPATAFEGLDMRGIGGGGIWTAAIDGCGLDVLGCETPFFEGPAVGRMPLGVA